ncbi:MAG: hypothetical protein OWQ50_08845, partial [Acidianus infernus]|nr:hypothetical protein [Acidianus infernus]
INKQIEEIRNKIGNINNQIKEKNNEIENYIKQLKGEKVEATSSRPTREEIIEKKKKIAEEKLKSGQRLTFEELLILYGENDKEDGKDSDNIY